MTDFMKLADEKRKAAERIETLSLIYEKIKFEMQWNTMDWHDSDDNHDEAWYTEPTNKEDYRYNNFQTYMEVLSMIEKLAMK